MFYCLGHGIPKQCAASGCPVKIVEQLLPSAAVVAAQYEEELGFSLNIRVWSMSFYLRGRYARSRFFFRETYLDISLLCNKAANQNFVPFQDALLSLIRYTRYSLCCIPVFFFFFPERCYKHNSSCKNSSTNWWINHTSRTLRIESLSFK